MSSTLYWRPVPKDQPPPEALSSTLKKVIAQRFWGHDGSLYGDQIEVGKEDVPYLQGLADAGVEDADDLLLAVNLHGSVLIWIGG